jgi:long-subunit fatty acid transport protein
MSLRRAIVLPLLLLPASAAADGFLLFQHGGRTTAQAGAFAARASDPSAVRFNPAAIARLDGLQFQAGLDFLAPSDDFESAGRVDSPNHLIQFPPALYLSLKPKELAAPVAFGISVDAPLWNIQNWDTDGFPGRFDTLRQELTLYEIRPTVAWAIDERWSLCGALSYVDGNL